jgi:hypothetical protein
VSQIFIDCGKFLVIHSSDLTPRHLFADFMAVGINAGAHGGNELSKLPALDEIEGGSERPQLPRHASGQITSMAFPAILIRQDVFAKLKGQAYLAATLGTKAKPCPSLKYRPVPDSVDLLSCLNSGNTSADLERHDLVAMQLEDVIEVHRTTRKIA